MKQLIHIHELTAQERMSIRGGSAVLPPELIALLQLADPEYIRQVLAEILSPYPPSQFPAN
jgi:hypothetical protein